jgi:hypothetical protein
VAVPHATAYEVWFGWFPYSKPKTRSGFPRRPPRKPKSIDRPGTTNRTGTALPLPLHTARVTKEANDDIAARAQPMTQPNNAAGPGASCGWLRSYAHRSVPFFSPSAASGVQSATRCRHPWPFPSNSVDGSTRAKSQNPSRLALAVATSEP